MTKTECSIIGCNNDKGDIAGLFTTEKGEKRNIWLCYIHLDEWKNKVEEVNENAFIGAIHNL